MSSIKPSFTGEIQLAGWSDTHNGGAKITFWLPDAESLEVFKGLTAKKGNTAGHRFMAALVEIGDDEQPVQPPEATTRPEPKPQTPFVLTVQWCKEPEFWAWLNQLNQGFSVQNEYRAADAVKKILGVASRKELETSDLIRSIWRRTILQPYTAYREWHE